MKAALNRIPSLSVLDGWWIEGCLEGTTAWAIGHGGEIPENPPDEAASLYDKLELKIMPLYLWTAGSVPRGYAIDDRDQRLVVNTQRMLQQYISNTYVPDIPAVTPSAKLAALAV